jgi:hypothetical protein
MPMNNRTMRPLASAWTPKAVPGLFAWYDFADSSSITLNSGNISQINDKSGNGKTMTQATAAAQPAMTFNALNGRSAATFTGTQWLQSATAADWKFLHYGSDKSMVFVVLKGNGDGSNIYEVLGTTVTIAEPGLILYWSGGDLVVGAQTVTTNGTANYAETFFVDLFTGRQGVCVIGDPSASDGYDRLLMARNNDRNAADMSFNEYDYGPQDSNPNYPLTLGRSGTGTGNFTPFNGIIAEVIVYKRSSAFTASERARVFDYLAAKWAL